MPFSTARRRVSVAGSGHPSFTWATITCPTRSCSSVRSLVNLHLPDADIILPARNQKKTDKYSQIYRILLPICNTLSQLPTLYKSPALRAYIDAEYGSLDALYLDILGDFFRHAFDGSGADNFYDAGSCIDGRLTSAWNWCSSLEKKHYFHVFLLSGTLPELTQPVTISFSLTLSMRRVRRVRRRVVGGQSLSKADVSYQ